jgi:hypothetical protein
MTLLNFKNKLIQFTIKKKQIGEREKQRKKERKRHSTLKFR